MNVCSVPSSFWALQSFIVCFLLVSVVVVVVSVVVVVGGGDWGVENDVVFTSNHLY